MRYERSFLAYTRIGEKKKYLTDYYLDCIPAFKSFFIIR